MKKGISIRESIEISYHAQIKLDRFIQADGETLSQAWGRFIEIISVLDFYQHSDSELFRYFTTNLHGSTIEFLRRTRVSKFEDLKWAAALDNMFDDARSTGSLTLAVKPDDRELFKFIFANVSEAGDIDGVYISREGDLLHLRTSTTPEIETLELPTENEYLATLGAIVNVVRSTGALSIVADDASERKLHDYIMRNISDAGTIDDGVYARVEGDKIHFYTVRTEEMCEGTDDIVCDVVPEPSPLPDLSPQLEPVEYVEPTIEELVEEMLADSYNDDYEALLEEDEQSVEVPLQFLGEEFRFVMGTHDAQAHEFHQSFISHHHQVQLMIDNLKTMDAQLKDAPIAERLTNETKGEYFQMPNKPKESNEEFLEEDLQSAYVLLQFLGEDEQSADAPLQFLGEEFSLVIETQDAKAHEFHQNFLSSHHQVQLVIDNLKMMEAQLNDAPIAECRTFEPEGDYLQLPDEPEEINMEIDEMVQEDRDIISEKCCQPNLNLIIYVDDPLWENFNIGEKSSHQVIAACFSQLIGGLLREMLEAALLGLVGGCEAAQLAEPRKVQIEQLDAPIKIPDPPFLQVDSIQ